MHLPPSGSRRSRTQNTTELTEKFGHLARYLESELGVPVEFVPATDYTASVEMFKNGDIQLAWFGGLTGVQARDAVDGARAIAQGDSDPEYYSYFIANAETGLEKSADFPTGDRRPRVHLRVQSSTSGRLMPSFFIAENAGVPADQWFTKPAGFSGSHDATAKLVESGQFQAGVLNYKVYDKMVADGELDPEKCRVIWKTPRYADYNFTAHPALETMFGAGFTDKLQAALVGVTDRQISRCLPPGRDHPGQERGLRWDRRGGERPGVPPLSNHRGSAGAALLVAAPPNPEMPDA